MMGHIVISTDHAGNSVTYNYSIDPPDAEYVAVSLVALMQWQTHVAEHLDGKLIRLGTFIVEPVSLEEFSNTLICKVITPGVNVTGRVTDGK